MPLRQQRWAILLLSERPDAIFGINDTVAFAAMKEIKRRGLRIPEDVALVGFTDEFHSTVVEPALTSITHPTFEIGQEAARLFFRCVENPDSRTRSGYSEYQTDYSKIVSQVKLPEMAFVILPEKEITIKKMQWQRSMAVARQRATRR